RTRVQRLLAYVLLGLRRDAMESFLGSGPLYLHLLGSSRCGRDFMAFQRKSRLLPLIGNYSRIYPTLKRRYGKNSRLYRLAEAMVHCEVKATALYTLLLKEWTGADRNRDFFTTLIH
ncbi:MAG TPA: nucleotidyltransferase family protein, partial [Desulfuromonadales bacterium]|nr:nucleotidyltransferase family protein [Desulfuromonadales bacterium]